MRGDPRRDVLQLTVTSVDSRGDPTLEVSPCECTNDHPRLTTESLEREEVHRREKPNQNGTVPPI